ncbi:RND family efflux transporter, MFP subunit [Marivirga sericea]|jgi:RND family efflux transporter MFP subunit|uniref:RND family efflux transporter, MFP subunit n=1 Tax=Marivirga sericea TaxID=1028 RepID=A0A1X7J5J8_9BACT|nr:efflux RND transporter periplasmic adaptor subunit [Marivirga sericea]SMG22770.1 RND family efflux transporter, MFP subunit [Marivirga sericea]
MRYIIILIALLAASCQSTEEHGHAHDAAGGHIDEAGEIPRVDYTRWTDKTELFVEFPVLVVGKTSRFAAHFTVLKNHKPVREGSVTVSLVKEGKGIRHTVEAPSSPGIFSPSLQPKTTGSYQLMFDIKTPQYQDRIVINDIRVFADAEEAISAVGNEEDGGAISFLKEQAWKIDFQTAPVVSGEIYDVIKTSGVWKAAPGAIRSLSANASGVVSFAMDNLTEGTEIKQGQVLMTISSKGLTSNNLQTEIEQARANFEQAKAEYERKKQLYESKIVPKAELEQVESKYKVAKSNYETLKAGYSAGGKQVTAPFDGYVKSISISNGDFVSQGAQLLTIGSHRTSLLETQVSASYASVLQNIQNVFYQKENGQWSSIQASGGSVLSVGKEVESTKPLLSVYAQITEEIKMPEGSFTEVEIAYGEPKQAVVIPEAALLEDYGSYSVIVQLSGESFERRPVMIGRSNGEFTEITEGLETGEVVVARGAYQVKMASMSGTTPAHGHEH